MLLDLLVEEAPACDNSFTEVMIGPEGADTMVELRGEWKDRIKIEAAIALRIWVVPSGTGCCVPRAV